MSCGPQNVLFGINLHYKLNPQTHLSTQPECHVEHRKHASEGTYTTKQNPQTHLLDSTHLHYKPEPSNISVSRNLHYKLEPSNSPLNQKVPYSTEHTRLKKPTLHNENPQNSPLSQQTPTLQIRTLKPTSQSAGPPDPAGCRKTCRSAGRCAQTWGRRTCGTSAAPPAWSASPPWSAGSQSMTPAAPQTWCSHPSPLQQSDTSLPAAWWVGGTSLLRVVSHLRCAPTYWREKNRHRRGHPVSLSRYDRYAAHIVFLHCVMLNCVALNMLKAKNQHRYGFIYPLSGLYDRYAEHIALAITV